MRNAPLKINELNQSFIPTPGANSKMNVLRSRHRFQYKRTATDEQSGHSQRTQDNSEAGRKDHLPPMQTQIFMREGASSPDWMSAKIEIDNYDIRSQAGSFSKAQRGSGTRNANTPHIQHKTVL